VTYTRGQDCLILQHKNNPRKQKTLKLEREYSIKTNDNSYISQIINHTDTTLSIVDDLKGKDTIVIPFRKIQYLQKNWFKDKDFLIFPWYIGIASTIGIVFIPIASHIEDGQVNVKFLKTAIIASAISWSIIYIGTRKIKYDTQNKWTITVRKVATKN
jgi:hypothetical protein